MTLVKEGITLHLGEGLSPRNCVCILNMLLYLHGERPSLLKKGSVAQDGMCIDVGLADSEKA